MTRGEVFVRGGRADHLEIALDKLVQAGASVLPGPDGQLIPVRGIQSGTYEAGKPARRARYRIYEVSERVALAGRPSVAREVLRVWDPERARFVDDEAASGADVAA